jgi:hypothetical protein
MYTYSTLPSTLINFSDVRISPKESSLCWHFRLAIKRIIPGALKWTTRTARMGRSVIWFSLFAGSWKGLIRTKQQVLCMLCNPIIYIGCSLLDARYFVAANTKVNSSQPVAQLGLQGWSYWSTGFGAAFFFCIYKLLCPGATWYRPHHSIYLFWI